MDLRKLTPQQLKNLLVNNQRHGRDETVLAVLEEMRRRGIATKRDYRALAWNQDRVREVMEPFKKIAAGVPGNQRTTYTEAGGLKIGRAKSDPESTWIDTYSAIKTPKINAVFVCYVKRPGDEPDFRLKIDETDRQSFNADQLDTALDKWTQIAHRAL